jgi:hypothetical protein
MVRSQSLFEHAVAICNDYLGPAGERFMRRQISTHLQKEPEDLKREDLPELTNWARLTMAMLTDESQLIDDFSERLEALGKQQPRTKRKTDGGR